MISNRVLVVQVYGDFDVRVLDRVLLVPAGMTGREVKTLVDELKEKYRCTRDSSKVIEELLGMGFSCCKVNSVTIGGGL